MMRTPDSQGKWKKALLKLFADNLTYDEYMLGLTNLTDEQLEIMSLHLVDEIKKRQQNIINTKEAIEKNFPIKSLAHEYESKPQSEIHCCLHCGSMSFKKHGKTRSGVQRYICKDCGKTFSENYGLITYYTHLSEWQWKEVIRGIIAGISLTEIAQNIDTSVSTAWLCRMKIYQTLKNIYGYGDTFNNIVEADGKYERISFKGKKDKKFFIDTLGRLPRHHRNRSERKAYIESAGKYEELFKNKPGMLKEMLFGSQKKLAGLNTIDKNHQNVCILTAIDRSNNIYMEPVTAGTADSQVVYGKFAGKISKDAVIVTDEHRSYKYLTRKEKLTHIQIKGGTYTNGAFNLARVNSLHSSMDRFFGRENKPATKYLDLYLMMFWWLQKNKGLKESQLSECLYDTMIGKVSNETRAKMSRVTIRTLTARKLPINTMGYYPESA